MQPVSAAFRAAMATDHTAVAKAEVFRGGLLVKTLKPVAGRVSVDAANAIRRRCQVALVDEDGTLTPQAATDALTPYGSELRLYRGLRTKTGTKPMRNTDLRNLCPPMSEWTRNGVTLDGEDLVFTARGQSASVMVRIDGAPSWHFGVDMKATTLGTTNRHLFGSGYFREDGSTGVANTAGFTGNGDANASAPDPMSTVNYERHTWRYLNGGGRAVTWVRFTIENNDAYTPVAFRATRPSVYAGTQGYLDALPALQSPTDLYVPYYSGTEDVFTDEFVPLGVFSIADVDMDDNGDALVLKVDGFDRARKVSRAALTDVYTVAAGTNYPLAIQSLINSRYPGLQYSLAPITSTTPLLVFDAGDDPWKRAQEMADNIGCDLFFDAQGVVTLKARASATAADWTFAEGAGATILDLGRKVQDEQTYNHVVVTGESGETNAPVRAEARDTDPASPTYYLGDYGDVVRFYASNFISTTAQAQAVADAFLARSLGLTEQVALSAIPMPALDAGDVVQVTRARAKVAGLYVIDALDIPLDPREPMRVQTRKRRL